MAECFSPEVPLFSHVWQTVFEAAEPCSHWLRWWSFVLQMDNGEERVPDETVLREATVQQPEFHMAFWGKVTKCPWEKRTFGRSMPARPASVPRGVNQGSGQLRLE